jgi:hypothetical protein
MPKVSVFYGIVIRMYWNERDHQLSTSMLNTTGAMRR